MGISPRAKTVFFSIYSYNGPGTVGAGHRIMGRRGRVPDPMGLSVGELDTKQIIIVT